ncbi:MAG: AsmA family protein [Candidatus Omnitrophica bacterium]|nr:AsmA family protein [Candidatus Omnitrophota bacterium]
MKKKTKILISIGVGLLIILIVLLACKDILIKQGVKIGVKTALGLEMDIGKLKVGLLSSMIHIEDMKIYNPKGFGPESLADIPLIYVDYDLGSVIRGKIHCPEIEINIKEVAVVKNEQGELNLNEIKSIADKSAPEQAQEETAPADKKKDDHKKELEMQIDKLVLTIGQVRFLDYSNEEKPKERTMMIGLDHEVFNDLNSIGEIVRVIVLKTVMTAGLKNIGLAVDKLSCGLESAAGELTEQAGKLKDKTKETLKKLNIFNK